jgi:hypothetical protein
MSIKASSTAEVRPLIVALGGDDDIAREAAIARLAIIGERAVVGLVSAYGNTTDRRVQTAVLRAMDPVADPRGLPLARAGLAAGGDVALAAIGVLRGLLHASHADAAAAALDTLMATVLDDAAEHRLRREAADALGSVPSVREQVARALEGIPDAAPGASDTEATWQDAVEGRLPDDPAVLREAAALHASAAPLGVLQQLIDRARERESGGGRLAGEWRGVCGALHQALALRGSRVALYDLRESLAEAADPLPPSFLAALHAVGDESCLDGIAAAFEATGDARWQAQLRDAFQAIVRREHLTRRTATMKRLASKRPDAFRALTG